MSRRVRPRSSESSLSAALRPDNLRSAALTMSALAAVMVILQVLNAVTDYALNGNLGLVSRRVAGLDGILFAPLLHDGWPHLAGNLAMLLLLGALLFVGGVREFVIATACVWLLGGLGVWLLGPSNTVTIGSSSLVYGWLAYLIARGIFTRSIWQLLIGAVLAVLYWGVLWSGIVQTAWIDLIADTNVSWQGHLFGAVGGVVAAVLLGRRVRGRVVSRERRTGPVI